MAFSAVFDRKDEDRGITTELWKGIPTNANGNDPRFGMFRLDDFHGGLLVDNSSGDGTFVTPDGVYIHTAATNDDGLASIDAASGGIGAVKLDAETNVAGEGLTLTDTLTVVPVAGRDIAFEFRLKLSQAGTVTQFMAGLLNAACIAPLTGGASLVVNTTNVTDAVSFNNLSGTNPSASLFTYNDEAGETAVQGTSAVHTLASGTYFKGGLRIYGTTRAVYWVNGEVVATYIAGSGSNGSIPSVALSRTIAVQSDDGATTANAIMDWWAIGQTPLALT